MEPWLAVALVVLFGIGLGCGFFMGRNKDDKGDKIKALESDLVASQAQLSDYRQQVNDHFGKTAELFNQLTDDYRAVYEHLAKSSHALCGDQVAQITADVPQKGLLEQEVSAEAPPTTAEQAPVEEAESKVEAAAEQTPTSEEAQQAAAKEEEKVEVPAVEKPEAVASEQTTRTIH